MVEIFWIITRQAIRRGTFPLSTRADRCHPPVHRRVQRTRPALHLDLIAAYSNTYDLVTGLRELGEGLPPTYRGGLTYGQPSKQDQQ